MTAGIPLIPGKTGAHVFQTRCRKYPAAICGVFRTVATSQCGVLCLLGRERPRSAAAFRRRVNRGFKAGLARSEAHESRTGSLAVFRTIPVGGCSNAGGRATLCLFK